MAEHDPTDLNAIAQAEKLAKDSGRVARDLEIDDVKFVMSDKRGRRHMHRVLERSGVYRLSFNTNALSMAFAEGNRNEGLRILTILTEFCPDLYTLMLKEQKENGRRNDAGRRD